MSIRNRPYLGGFQLNRTFVRYTPDCLVYIQGSAEFAVCSDCNKFLDFNKYITQVSCDASTEPNATATITLTIPPHELDKFRQNGNYVLQPALEVVIFMRGYFPMTDFGGLGQAPETDEYNPDDVPMYPYYQVFRGVVINVSHDFSGGFYSANLSCQNLLYFWNNLYLSVNGAVFGPKSAGMGVDVSLVGHKFTSMNPYAIIYTLVKVGFGSAYGVDFQYSRAQNINARTDDHNTSIFLHAAKWWEKRWTENSGALRMYGINGQLFNAAQQSYYGSWADNNTTGFRENTNSLFDAAKKKSTYNIGSKEYKTKAREALFDPVMTKATLVTGQYGNTSVVDDVVKMQAFVYDISKLGNVNMFETEYVSKLGIVQEVTKVTGFEFYQDVDGDLVFKPPMYNMDTREDPVYVIKDRDLISVNETETEPSATMIKGTGSHFANVGGHGVETWMGVGAVYVDYRLVAKFGYKEETFETNYLSNRFQIYISAINRLDLANVGVKSAQITIPIRPELRPGYPVYIETLDSFFYAQSISHSFAVGGECTTTIQGVAKRSKWFPPVKPGGDSAKVIENMDLGGADRYPGSPIYIYPENIEGAEDGSQGPPRIAGLPNVVMALDSSDVTPVSYGISLPLTVKQYLQRALTSGFLQQTQESEGTTRYVISDGTANPPSFTESQVSEAFQRINTALNAGDTLPEPLPGDPLSALISSIYKQFDPDIEEAEALQNWLYIQTSLKAKFNPGSTLTGRYRYYSCSAPKTEDQAPNNTEIFDSEKGVEILGNPASEGSKAPVWKYGLDGNISKGEPTRFFRVNALSGKTGTAEKAVSTAEVYFVTFMPHFRYASSVLSSVDEGGKLSTNVGLNDGLQEVVVNRLLTSVDNDLGAPVSERFEEIRGDLVTALSDYRGAVAPEMSGRTLEKFERLLGLFRETLSINEKTSEISAKPDQSVIAGIIVSAAGRYYAAARMVEKSVPVNADYNQTMEDRAVFLEEVAGSGVDVPGGNAATIRVPLRLPQKKTTLYNPVFPVSDGEGFEVFGSLPYGRGITVQKYASLLQATHTVEDTTGDVTSQANSARVMVEGSSVTAGNLDEISNFYTLVFAAEDEKTPIGSLVSVASGGSSSAAAAIAASIGTGVDGLSNVTVKDVIEKVSYSADQSPKAFIRNSPVTSFYRGQSVSGNVAVVGLASLEPEESQTCICKGAEQDYYMMAFSQEYVYLYGAEGAVQGYESERIYYTGEQWKQSKDAIAGQAFEDQGNIPQQIRSLNTGSGGAGIDDAIQDILARNRQR